MTRIGNAYRALTRLGPSQAERDAFGAAAYNPFNNPSVPLSSVGLDSVFGALSHTDSGESVTIDTSLTLPIVWRCIGLLSTVIAGCPIRTYKLPGRTEVFPKIFDRGNATMQYSQFELWELVVVHLCLWGNAYVRKVRAAGGKGPIVDLVPINPTLVKVKQVEGNKVFLVHEIAPDGTVDLNAKPEVLTTFEVMHIPGLGYDGLVGLSPIQMAKRTIGTGIAGDKLAAKFFAKGSALSGIINVKAPLANQEQAEKIRQRWQQKSGGTAHAGEVAVLDAETTFTPLTIPPDSLQFLESRRWETTEVARWFGIPPHLVGDVEKSTSWGAGIEQQNVGFVSYTVSGWTNRIEQRATREVISTNKQYSEFDLDRLLRGDMAERYAAYAVGIQWGWLTRNEARNKENMNSIDGLDEPLTPLNMAAGPAMPVPGEPNAVPMGPAGGKLPGKGVSDPNEGAA